MIEPKKKKKKSLKNDVLFILYFFINQNYKNRIFVSVLYCLILSFMNKILKRFVIKIKYRYLQPKFTDRN